MLDRLGGARSSKPESPALERLSKYLQLEDVRTLEESVDGVEEKPEPTDFYTWWGPEAASRLDRFYIPIQWTARVEWVPVEEPMVPSYHQQVQLHYIDKTSRQKAKRRRRNVPYPIKTAQPDRVHEALMKELAEAGVGSQTAASAWDASVVQCGDCIRRVANNEKQRQKATVQRIKAQNRAHLIQRKYFLRQNVADVHEEHLVRVGQRLERSREMMRWSFKRISNWEKDQTVTEIRHKHGKPFGRETTMANRFGSEWKSVLGVTHNEVPVEKMEEEFDKFVQIPKCRRISQQQNEILMREITADEVIAAIDSLNRNKAAGADGLNNDFYKDVQALLVAALVAIGNELLKGGEPPQSFLEGLIIPLRKKGDSADAMDFRPISLLQTGYKVYTKFIATRTQEALGTPIGDSQQGFVHGRQMLKTVMMMLAVLATANDEPELAAELSRVILLLDFRKAYDTVSRDFLFLALLKFGFSIEFVNMIRRLHAGTTARFLVNGELSDPLEIISGIRQGCPLAPLLFILAAEILAIAIKQDRGITGIQVPGSNGDRHSFSAFADDSAVFMQEARHIPMVTKIVKQFGRLSGLQVQPTKSHLIFLNKAVRETTFCGLPVVRHGDTVRYLGYEVGTGELTDVNWARRIRAVQRRLATATQLATSVENRVTILNVIMLPSVLFTAATFDMPQWAEEQLRNIQKQFLWRRTTSVEQSRHKINPGLVFAPKEAGGLGVTAITLACKTQRAKQTLLWLIQRKDIYFEAWRAWLFREAVQPWKSGISPRKFRTTRRGERHATPGDVMQQLVGEWIQPGTDRTAAEITKYQTELEEMATEAVSWSVDGEWLVELPRGLSEPQLRQTEDAERFWPTYLWNANPWIVDKEGRMLTTKKFNRIQSCTIEDLHITRIADMTYSFTIPDDGVNMHQQAKLRRWGMAILLNAPAIGVGERLEVKTRLQMRHPTQLSHEYVWGAAEAGKSIGTTTEENEGSKHTIVMEQQPDGVHWRVQEDNIGDPVTQEDNTKLKKRQHDGNIVFAVHPRLHGFPWKVKDSIANKHVIKVLKQQPYQRYKGEATTIENVVEGLNDKVKTSGWQKEGMRQTPKQLWAHKRELTEYQVWVVYRVAVRQVNLYYDGKASDNGCRKLEECRHVKETLEHIFWECPCAQTSWTKLIQQWTGESWTIREIQAWQRNCASRQAPELTQQRRNKIKSNALDEEKEMKQVWHRMWRILASVCIATLWIQRSRVVFHQAEITAESSAQEVWATGRSQLQALAKRERRSPEQQIQGTRLHLCIQEMEREPREYSPKAKGLVQPPGQDQEPALLTRLRKYQTSRRR